jgi:hypothetical protein
VFLLLPCKVNGGIGVDDAIDGVTGGTDKGKKSRMRGRSNNGVCFPLKKADPGFAVMEEREVPRE